MTWNLHGSFCLRQGLDPAADLFIELELGDSTCGLGEVSNWDCQTLLFSSVYKSTLLEDKDTLD